MNELHSKYTTYLARNTFNSDYFVLKHDELQKMVLGL